MILLQCSKILVFSILFLILNNQNEITSGSTYTKLDSILTVYDTYVQDFVKETEVPGVAIAIVIDNQLQYIKGFGVKNTVEKEPIGIHSVFRIASVSKGFASILAGLLVKEGVLKWDDPVKKYLPEFILKDSTTTQNLTIRHILSHTSGLTPHAYDNLIEANIPFDKIIERLKEVNVHCPAGECYGYQNTVYSLISEIIKSATKKNYIDVLQQKIIQPLGMQDVSYSREKLLAIPNRADPHIRRNGEWIPSDIRDSYYNVKPAAGINASIYDMAYWLKALLGGMPDVISPEIIKEVSKPIIQTPKARYRYNGNIHLHSAYYGLGWRIFDYAGYKMVFHSGGVHGYHSKIAFIPEQNIGIVVLQNGRYGNNFVYKFIDLYLNLEQKESFEEAG